MAKCDFRLHSFNSLIIKTTGDKVGGILAVVTWLGGAERNELVMLSGGLAAGNNKQ